MRISALLPAFSFLIILLSQPACAQHHPAAAEVTGQVTLQPDWQPRLYVVRPQYYRQVLAPYEGRVIDTIDLEPDGSFQYVFPDTAEKTLYVLYAQPTDSRYPNGIEELPARENYITLIPEPGAPIVLNADISALNRSYRLKQANAESHTLAQLRDCRAPLYLEEAQTDTDEETDTHGNAGARKAVNEALDHFLDTSRTALPLFVAFRLRAGDNEFRDRPEFSLQVLDRLRTLAPGHPWVDQLAFFLQPDRLPVLKGEKMPDFALPTPEGDTLHLSDLRARLLLVDFWASWCAPCRLETREVIRPLYEQYHEKGFNVLGVSIDRSRTAWMAAIEKDGAIWPNVSDLLGDPSPVRQSLKFEYIPANYLLDAEGRLLARNVHGDTLRELVRQYLSTGE
ncbi:MAG: TlpA family protein disulfide reductase [Bacteroidetes bacterium]|nr:MAG: TlpA family protein disulfide reductase [Bacteroidota bacterium]